jgi:heme O synthase-like polyprenyltransferase
MNRKTLAGDRRRRKMVTLVWALALAAVVITLIYFEKTAILYILCTLGVTALLLVVAFSDLGQSREAAGGLDQQKDAASVADRIS